MNKNKLLLSILIFTLINAQNTLSKTSKEEITEISGLIDIARNNLTHEETNLKKVDKTIETNKKAIESAKVNFKNKEIQLQKDILENTLDLTKLERYNDNLNKNIDITKINISNETEEKDLLKSFENSREELMFKNKQKQKRLNEKIISLNNTIKINSDYRETKLSELKKLEELLKSEPSTDTEKLIIIKKKAIIQIADRLTGFSNSLIPLNNEMNTLVTNYNKLDDLENNILYTLNNLEFLNTELSKLNSEKQEYKEKLEKAEETKKEIEEELVQSQNKLNKIEKESNKIIKDSYLTKYYLEKAMQDHNLSLENNIVKLNAAKVKKLNKALNQNNVTDIFESVLDADEKMKLPPNFLDSDEELQELVIQLKDIKSNSPYAFSMKTNRDSIKSFEDNMGYLTIKPNENQWIGQGKVISNLVKKEIKSSLKDEEGVTIESPNRKSSTKINGAIGSVEYGINDTASLGFAIGGNNQSTKFKDSNSIKGTSMYLGAFAKKDIANFKFKGGFGYQLTDVKTNRNNFSSNYKQNSYDIFAEGKYVITLQKNFTLEPKVKISYFDINQDKIKEKFRLDDLSIGVNKANQKTGDILIGLDFIKSSQLELGKLNTIFSVGISNALGNREKELTGYIIGHNKIGKNFKLDSVAIPKTTGNAGLNFEFEQTSGFIYNAGVDFQFAEGYSRNLQLNIGAGYKF